MFNNSEYRDNDNINTSSTESGSTESGSTESGFSDSFSDRLSYNRSYYSENSNSIINIISSKYKLLIPEIFNEQIHGITSESDPNINGQLVVQESFIIKTNTCFDELFYILKKRCKFYNKCYKVYYNNVKHNYIRNYNNIIKNSNYMKPEIGEMHYLRGDECVCILKTFWLKIIQRAWKKIYKLRQKIFKLRCRPDSVLYRQLTGKFPDNCSYMPSIRGMLLPY
jgi:hypothetical protein